MRLNRTSLLTCISCGNGRVSFVLPEVDICISLSLLLQMIKDIMAAVTIPVMAKARIGHFAEAQILEALGVDMVDESEGEW